MKAKPPVVSLRRQLLRWFVRGLANFWQLVSDEQRDARLDRQGYYYCLDCQSSHRKGTRPCDSYSR